MIPALGRVIDFVIELATEASVMMLTAKMTATRDGVVLLSNLLS